MNKKILFCLFIFGLIAIVPNVSASGEGWLDGWDHRQGITITGSSGASTNYQIKLDVTYDANMQPDFDDLRFTDDDGQTELDYWTEKYTASTSATVWVEVTDDLNTTQAIYMYYGNSTVSSLSDGDATFLFFDDFTGEAINSTKWNITQGTEPDDVDVSGGYLAFLDAADENTMVRGDGYTGTTGRAALEMSLYWESTFQFRAIGWSEWRADGYFSYDADIAVIETTGADAIDCEDNGDNGHTTDNPELSDSVWNRIGMYYLTDAHHEFWVNGVEKQDYTSSVPDATMFPFFGTHSADEDNEFLVDWLFIRNIIAPEPVAVFGLWNDLEPASFLFSVAFDMWGMDTALIILGLIMIPTSTIYLAYGAKHDRSSDRLFYGLIIFFLGCGLFIGGILP